MARRKKRQAGDPNGVKDFRFEEAKRKNNPPAGLAPTYETARERETKHYAYDPHLDPALQFDPQRAKIEALHRPGPHGGDPGGGESGPPGPEEAPGRLPGLGREGGAHLL